MGCFSWLETDFVVFEFESPGDRRSRHERRNRERNEQQQADRMQATRLIDRIRAMTSRRVHGDPRFLDRGG